MTTTRANADMTQIQGLLDSAVDAVGAPGAVLGIWDGDRRHLFASGIASVVTRAPVTVDTLFLTGSIQKVFSASLVMSFVENGALSLDIPVAEVIDGFELADTDAAESITLRHLLGHTSGIDGDLFFPATGRGDDAIERYVADCAALGQLFRPGDLVSYCNANFVIAARAVEVAAGTTYDTALQDRVLEPLGLHSSMTAAEDAILRPVAIGHFPGKDGAPARPTPSWCADRGSGPAGGTMAATIGDLLEFGRWHLRNRQEMQEPQDSRDARMRPRGLGWELDDWSGTRILSHDGFNSGQCASLRVIPEKDVVVAMMVNFARGPLVARPVLDEILQGRLGIAPRSVPDEDPSVDPAGFRPLDGTYERRDVRYEVRTEGRELTVAISEGRPSRAPRTLKLRPICADRFLVELPVFGDVEASFILGDAGDRARYFCVQGRVARRVDA